MRADKISFGQHISGVKFDSVNQSAETAEKTIGAKGSTMVLDGDVIKKNDVFCILDGDGYVKTAKFVGSSQDNIAGNSVTQIMYQVHNPHNWAEDLFGPLHQSAAVQQINSVEHPLLQLFSPKGIQDFAHRVSSAAYDVRNEIKLANLYKPR